jgi:hypothetical protein
VAITRSLGLGFPIRTSPDHRSFTSSPRLFAGTHVLHRLFPPRHPPYALIHLTIYPPIPSGEMTRPRTGHLAFPSSLVKEHTAHLPMYSAQPKALHCPLPTPRTRRGSPTPPSGGADRSRTGDPRLAKPVLSQLSYSPMWWAQVDSNH